MKINILCIFMVLANKMLSQNYINTDSIFAKLDRTKWTTNILYVGNESLFNNKNDSMVNLSVFRKYLFEIVNNSIKNNPNILIINIDSLYSMALNYYERTNTIPIGVLFLRYNYIRQEAIDSGYISFINGQFIEQTNQVSKIYGEDTLVMCAPLVQQFDTLNIHLKFDHSFLITNVFFPTQNAIKLNVLHKNTLVQNNNKLLLISDSVKIHCDSFNNKIEINLQYFNQSRSFYFSLYSYPQLRSPSDVVLYVGNSYNDAIGKATIRYGCGNNTSTIRKPFIFVEGFDPIDENTNLNNYGRLHWEIFSNWNNWINNLSLSDRDLDHDGIWDYQNLQKGKTLVDRLNADGFDIIYLEFKNSSRNIEDNARVLEALLYIIGSTQSISPGNLFKQKSILAGGSMGGLITRMALNFMEDNYNITGIISKLHNIRTWITFDTPFLGYEGVGANIPLGDQYFVRFFGNGTGANNDAQKAYTVLNTVAAQQMLFYHHMYSSDVDNSTSGANAVASASSLYYQLGQRFFYYSIPLYLRNKIGISNGSNKGIYGNQGYGWGAQMVDMTSSCSGTPQGRGIGKTWAIPDGYTQKIFEGHKQLCFNFSDITTSENWMHYSLPIDNAPGGNRYTNKSLVFPGGGTNYPNHCFVPTISSLGIDLFYLYLQTGKYDLYYDLRNQIFLNPSINYVPHPNIAYIKTPKKFYNDISPTFFDVLYAPNNNQQHVEITDDNINFIMNEIAPTDLYLQNETYPLNNLPFDTDQFEARNTITAGKNVTPKTAVGNFVINPGANISFRAGDKITLKDGFSAKAGSTFRAYIDPFPCPPVNRLSNNNDNSKSYVSSFLSDSVEFIHKPDNQSNTSRSLNKKILLIPNPASSSINIQTTNNSRIQAILLKDLTGKVLLQQNFPSASTTASIDVSTLSNGLYLLEIHTSSSVVTEKLVVQK